MEDYKVRTSTSPAMSCVFPAQLFHRLSEGPLGPTLLVEDRASGDKCVVKQVECRDYTQALLAYNQVRGHLHPRRMSVYLARCPYT